MRLSVVIVNWNTSKLLDALLESVAKWPPPFEHEVVVVDNASDDFDAAAFSARHPGVKLIANTTNAGYAEGNNQGISASGGDYALLLNPDTEVTEGALGHLVEFMQSHPDAAAAGAKLVRPDGTVDRSVRSFPYPGPIAWEFMGLARLFPGSRVFGRYRMTWFNYDEVARVDQPMGSCLILSREAIDRIGTFDTRFPIFFNEVDWLYRAKQAGYNVYFTPGATVIHHGAASTKQAGRRAMVRESHDSLVRFYEKHFRRSLPAPVCWFAIGCIKLGRMLRG
jgi:hypothetical protein